MNCLMGVIGTEFVCFHNTTLTYLYIIPLNIYSPSVLIIMILTKLNIFSEIN